MESARDNIRHSTIFLGELCVHTWGSLASQNRPALVLLHGFMQSGESWNAIARELATEHYVVAPDLLGHGQSPKPTDPQAYTLDNYVVHLASVVRHLQLQGFSVVLVGYSFGGRVAAQFLSQQNGMVAAAVLESAGLGPTSTEERQARMQKSLRMIARLQDDSLEAFVNFWEGLPLFETQKALPADVRGRVRAERLANEPQALAYCLQQAGQQNMQDLREPLKHSSAPILYLAGAHDVAYTEIAQTFRDGQGADQAFAPAQPFPQSTGVQARIIPDAGHNIHLEQPQAFLAALKQFLAD